MDRWDPEEPFEQPPTASKEVWTSTGPVVRQIKPFSQISKKKKKSFQAKDGIAYLLSACSTAAAAGVETKQTSRRMNASTLLAAFQVAGHFAHVYM